MNRFYTTLRAIAYWPMKLLFPAKVIGYENLPVPQKVITVSNHLSMIDIILVGVNVYGYRHFVAKKERIPHSGILRRGAHTYSAEHIPLQALGHTLRGSIVAGQGLQELQRRLLGLHRLLLTDRPANQYSKLGMGERGNFLLHRQQHCYRYILITQCCHIYYIAGRIRICLDSKSRHRGSDAHRGRLNTPRGRYASPRPCGAC